MHKKIMKEPARGYAICLTKKAPFNLLPTIIFVLASVKWPWNDDGIFLIDNRRGC